MNGQKVLITGAGGYIGSVMSDYLINQGYKVTCLDIFFSSEADLAATSQQNIEIIREDVRSFSKDILKNIDIVVDLAGISNESSAQQNPVLTEEINVEGSLRVCCLAREMGVKRYIFASSCSVYGQGTDALLDEESLIRPVSLYARKKAYVEKEVLAQSSPDFIVACARNAVCYGISPKMRFDLVVNSMALQAFKYNKIFIIGGGLQHRPFVHVKDISRAYEFLISLPECIVNGQIFNLGTDSQNYSIKDVAMAIKSVFPSIMLENRSQNSDLRSYKVSFSKLHRVSGFEAQYSLKEGISELNEALVKGYVEETVNTKGLEYMKYLLDTEKMLTQFISIDR